ncbi:MAG: MFS transporter [Bacteroidetes bacterium]|nr:MFS transporter [Bacteroidota bacterium]
MDNFVQSNKRTKGQSFKKDIQYYKFCSYGFLKNLRFFDAFILLFFLETGLTFLQIGTIYTIREISVNILEIPSGIIADSLGRRRTMIFSFISYIISFLIFYFATKYFLFVIAILFYAFGDAFRTGTHKAMIFEYLKIKHWENQKVYYYGHTRSASQIGSAVSALIAAAIVFYTGSYKVIFIYSVIPYCIDLLLMISYPKELDGELKEFKKELIKKKFKKVLKTFISSIKDIQVLKITANLSVYSGFSKISKDYIQSILQTFALSLPLLFAVSDKQQISIVVGISYFVIYFITSIAARNSGNFSSFFKNLNKILNLSLILGFLMGGFCGFFYNRKLFAFSIIFFVIILIIENIRKPIGVAYLSDKTDEDILTTILSFESQIKTLTAAILAPVLGFFADKYGVGNSFIIVSAILIIISPLYFLNFKEKNNFLSIKQ